MHRIALAVQFLIATSTCSNLLEYRDSTIWQPEQGMSWNYWIGGGGPQGAPANAKVMGIDLFDNTAEYIKQLQSEGARVICYFSAGSYENWRTDWNASKSDLGDPLSGWSGEWWVDIRKQDVRDAMARRIALAQEKGCDAVDPDNVDGYQNEPNGLNLTAEDSLDYVNFLSTEAHSRGLAVSLKNCLDLVDELTPVVDFAVNEQCHENDECDSYANFTAAGKNVFHVEYPKGDLDHADDKPVNEKKAIAICTDPTAQTGFSTIMKNMNLDAFIQFCSKDQDCSSDASSNGTIVACARNTTYSDSGINGTSTTDNSSSSTSTSSSSSTQNGAETVASNILFTLSLAVGSLLVFGLAT